MTDLAAIEDLFPTPSAREPEQSRSASNRPVATPSNSSNRFASTAFQNLQTRPSAARSQQQTNPCDPPDAQFVEYRPQKTADNGRAIARNHSPTLRGTRAAASPRLGVVR